VNWKFIIFLGLILTLSPFYFLFENVFLFHYSILGYGLILISFYYKKELKSIDILIIVCMIFLIFLGVFNQFQMYSFFGMLFNVLFLIMLSSYVRINFLKILVHIFIFIEGVLLPFFYLGIVLNNLNNFFYYFFLVFNIILLLILKID